MQGRPPPIATHHIDLSDHSPSSAIAKLSQLENDEYHPLRVSKLTLLGWGDEVADLCDWLAEEMRKHPWGCNAKEGSSREKPNRLPIRTFSLSNYNCTAVGYDAIARLVEKHGSLTTLELVMNSSRTVPDLRRLTSSIFLSLLRTVTLSSTKLTPQAFCDFIDGLNAPCLRELRMSLTLTGAEVGREDSLRAAASVAHLVRSSSQSDAHLQDNSTTASSRRGCAPQLELLTLNGCALTLRGVRMIVAAVVGGQHSTPNRSLTHVELFATSQPGEVDSDQEGESSEVQTGQGTERRRRTVSIGRSFVEARRARRRDEREGMPSVDVATSSSSSVGSSRPHPASNSASSCARQHQILGPEDPRCYRHISSANWRSALNAHLWQNVQDRSAVIAAATLLLAKARVLGCRSQLSYPEDKMTDTMDLTSLPPEIRLEVLRALDDEHVLSEGQFRRVIAWACDASTIGYGRHTWRPQTLSPDERADDRAGQGLIPTQPHDWPTTLSRSPPRDWAAEAYDEWSVAKSHGLLPLPDPLEGGQNRRETKRAPPPGGEERCQGIADAAFLAFLEGTRVRFREDH